MRKQLLCLFLGMFAGMCNVKGNSDEKKLIQTILQDYDINVRPVRNYEDSLVVNISVILTKILDLDERNQILSGYYWIRLGWSDASLQWDPDNYAGITIVRIQITRLWQPDITLYNDVSSPGRSDSMELSLYPARVSHKGFVLWDFPLILKSSCRINVRYFPFDEQQCILEFGSWTYDGHQLDVYNHTRPNQLDYFHGDGEWDLSGFGLAYHEEYYSEFYPSVRYTLHLKRKPLYYHVNIVVPCLSILLCSMLVFLLPPDSGEKIVLSVHLLLASTVFLLIVSELMPPQSEVIPLIERYFLAAILLQSASCMLTILCLNAHHHGNLGLRVPRLLYTLVLEAMAYPVFMRDTVSTVLALKASKISPAPNHSRRKAVEKVEEVENVSQKEWMLVAMILDRTFAAVFLLFTFIVTLAIFVHRD